MGGLGGDHLSWDLVVVNSKVVRNFALALEQVLSCLTNGQ